MTAATVLIPTHDHADTLTRAVASVQAQTLTDFELVIVGDGVPDRTRALVADIVRTDDRVRWFDFPKGPRHGEVHRHAALAEARGEIVCYLSDDDLWLPHHLQTLREALATADFAQTVHVDVAIDGQITAYPYDLTDPKARRRIVDDAINFFGLSFAGHTLAAYRRLPHGWRTTPAGVPTDLHMWRQFLAQPWCQARTVWRPSVLHFASPPRRDWSLPQRLDEIDRWVPRTVEVGFDTWLMAQMDRLRSETVSARDATITAQSNALAEQRRLITQFRNTSAVQQRDIAQLQAEIALRDHQLAEAVLAREAAQAGMAETSLALDAARAQVMMAKGEHARLAEAVAGLRAAVQRQQAVRAALDSASAQARDDLAHRDAQLDAIYRSRWWRVADRWWRTRRGLSAWLGARTGH
ncbi:MAG: glycosyltransferase [Chloroflexi bacterium]|nr:glycosyltransferase [Chloroflexota bacterium]